MKKKIASNVLFLLLCAGSLPCAVGANQFALQFDSTFDDIVSSPITGAGTIAFSNELPDGLYALSSLQDLQLNLHVSGSLFTQADIQSDLDLAAIWISDGGQVLQFSDIPPAGNGNGPYFGSLDLVNANADVLSFEPPENGGMLVSYFLDQPGTGSIFGTYAALADAPDLKVAAVPEPATMLLFGVGLANLVANRLPRRKNTPRETMP